MLLLYIRVVLAFCVSLTVDGLSVDGNQGIYMPGYINNLLIKFKHPHVGTLQNGYIRNVPLPRVPQIQSASLVTGDHGTNPGTCYSQVPRVPTWSDLGRLLQGLGRRKLLPLFPCWLM
jgi:hypothetical protein